MRRVRPSTGPPISRNPERAAAGGFPLPAFHPIAVAVLAGSLDNP